MSLVMSDQIDMFFSTQVEQLLTTFSRLEHEIKPNQPPGHDKHLAELRQAIAKASKACSALEEAIGDNPDLLKKVRARFQQAISYWFDQSWLVFKARTKPRGMPGDFALLEAMYEGVPKSVGIGGYLDFYYLETVLCRGVRARMKKMSHLLQEEIKTRKGRIDILSIGSGSCRELRELPTWLPWDEIRIVCIDWDQGALDWGKDAVIRAGLPQKPFEFIAYNALKMVSQQQNSKKFGSFDVLYTIGVCDYLPDTTLGPLLNGWREMLKNGGVMYISFKDATRYDKTEYQWFADWYFEQRTEEGCRRAFELAGFRSEQVAMQRIGETGVMIMFVAKAGA